MDKFVIKSPIGNLLVGVEGDMLVSIGFAKGSKGRTARSPFEREVAQQIKEYFQGKRKEFALPLKVLGTAFTQRVLKELWALDFGETISYSDLALRSGRPKASRAVARVMATNRLPIVLPCHRILEASGRLGGYGGGLRKKEYLLAHEGAFARS